MTKAPRRTKAVAEPAAAPRELPAELNLKASIAGDPAVGSVLTCVATFDGLPPQLFYQWMRGDLYIPGAEFATYQVKTFDAGHELSCKVVAHGAEITSIRTKRVKVA